MGHPVQLNVEGGAELRHRARQHHGTASPVFLFHGETVRSREGTYRGQVGSVGTMPLGKFIAAQKGTRRTTRYARGHSGRKILPSAPPHEHGHFQALGRIGGRERTGTAHRDAFAALERNVGHSSFLMLTSSVIGTVGSRAGSHWNQSCAHRL